MSHHLDPPIARQDPRLDITDFFLFRGERGAVFVMDVSHSLACEDIPRGWYPEGRYEFKIDGNGDAVEELTYRIPTPMASVSPPAYCPTCCPTPWAPPPPTASSSGTAAP
ncbi:DUF4331 family protein [Streptomyces odonnellii]|uniref:DUF4331 family protein n=1 Tax=Streptomyces odonnellii TaxID=1417980 RepID=UPI000AD88666